MVRMTQVLGIMLMLFSGVQGELTTGTVKMPTGPQITGVLASWQKVLEWDVTGCLVMEKFYREVVGTAAGAIIFKNTALVTQKRKLWAILTVAFGAKKGDKGLLGGNAKDMVALKNALAQLGNRHYNTHVGALEDSTVIDTLAAGHGIVAGALLTTLEFFYKLKKDTTWAKAKPQWVAVYGFVRQYMTVGTCCTDAGKYDVSVAACMGDKEGTFDKAAAWTDGGVDSWCKDGTEVNGAAKCTTADTALEGDTAAKILEEAKSAGSAKLHELIILLFVSLYLF